MSSPASGPQLNGTRKAAVLMALLGEDAAAAVYKNLAADDVQAITEELASLDRVTPEVAKQILEEYSQLVLTQDYLVEGGTEYATRLLVRAFGDEVAQDLLGRVARAQEMEGGKLGALQKADPQQLAKLLESEHPQAAALILAHMDTKQAASLLVKMSPQVQPAVVTRLANLRQFSPELVEEVSTVLNQRLRPQGERTRKAFAGLKSVAGLINRVRPEAANTILEVIEREDPKLAISIRDLMFTFEDLLQVPEASIRELLANQDRKTLTVALKGASQELKNHIMRTMSSRAVEMLKEDMDALGPVRATEVAKAQQEIIASARKLEAEGKLLLRAEGNDEYIV
jgi:flagellar motor switch protein FliG